MKRFCVLVFFIALFQPGLAFQTSTEQEVKVAYLWFQFLNGKASTNGHFIDQENEIRFKNFLKAKPAALHTLVNQSKSREGQFMVWSLVKVGTTYQIISLSYKKGGSTFFDSQYDIKTFSDKKSAIKEYCRIHNLNTDLLLQEI